MTSRAVTHDGCRFYDDDVQEDTTKLKLAPVTIGLVRSSVLGRRDGPCWQSLEEKILLMAAMMKNNTRFLSKTSQINQTIKRFSNIISETLELHIFSCASVLKC